MAVQKTKVANKEQTDRMVQPFRTSHNACVCHADGTSGGCIIFLNNSIGIVVEAVTVCEKGRFVVCDFCCCRVLSGGFYVYNHRTEKMDELTSFTQLIII